MSSAKKIIAAGLVVALLAAGALWWARSKSRADNAAVPAVAANIVGVWQSTEDKNFTREFNADGTATERYASVAPARETWTTFSKANPPFPSVAFPLSASTTYLQLKDPETGETFNFALAKLTRTSLELIYMDRGGASNYARVR